MVKVAGSLASLEKRMTEGKKAKSFSKSEKAKTEDIRPMTVRVTVEQHIKLKQRAAERQVTMSEIVGELIDSL